MDSKKNVPFGQRSSRDGRTSRKAKEEEDYMKALAKARKEAYDERMALRRRMSNVGGRPALRETAASTAFSSAQEGKEGNASNARALQRSASQDYRLPNSPARNAKARAQQRKDAKKEYFVKHCKQEMQCWNKNGEYHEIMFGPFNKTKAELIFSKIKNIKNLHYSVTQGCWKEISSFHGVKGIKRTTGCNYHNLGYYYEYLSIENPLKQATKMSVIDWLNKMDMTDCFEEGEEDEDR